MTDDLIRRANYALGDTQGRVDKYIADLSADLVRDALLQTGETR